MTEKLNEALEAAFAEATRRYRERGFQRRVGFGAKPALINVDLANAWTRPGNPFTCERIDDQVIPAVQKLLAAFRKHGFFKGGAKAAWRLLRCNPWSHGGVDPA